ncbi:GntR family transcriptional regulator [Breoghania corrubedonensis]|uniref:GntR family transcriptional regulator n=1 Tax=Breoghania corrubedonensis TaxID=665038 RepID=A0A2T5VFQ3_9HYPH|nr:GntR family transcriptional regulator [Breoghania corrubedonensis]PTW62583.1 GntR family transcriptional regulator [Breoghania corrubedonensis]
MTVETGTPEGAGGLQAFDLQPESSLAERAYEQLAQLILTKALPGGSSVVEGRLAKQLDISRTPMREAILRLAAEGLLVKQGSRSFAVRKVQPVEFFQALKLRELIEAEAVELAIGKVAAEDIEDLRAEIIRLGQRDAQETAHWELDDRLHMLFPAALGNAVMIRVLTNLRISTRLFELSSAAGRVSADATEHLAILEAFEKGDARRARAAMVTHLRNVAAETLDIVSGRDPGGPKRRSVK